MPIFHLAGSREERDLVSEAVARTRGRHVVLDGDHLRLRVGEPALLIGDLALDALASVAVASTALVPEDIHNWRRRWTVDPLVGMPTRLTFARAQPVELRLDRVTDLDYRSRPLRWFARPRTKRLEVLTIGLSRRVHEQLAALAGGPSGP